MKQNEHINNWIGSIVLMFSVILFISFTPNELTSSNTENTLGSNQLSSNNNEAIVTDAIPATDKGSTSTENSFQSYNHNNFSSELNIVDQQVKIKIKIAFHTFCHQKQNLLYTQIIQNHTSFDDGLIVS